MRLIANDSFDNIGVISFHQFQKACTGFEVCSALRLVQDESEKLRNEVFRKIDINDDVFGVGHIVISGDTNAFIAKHLLLNSSAIFEKSFKKSDYIKAVIYYNHLETDLSHARVSEPDAQRWPVRLLYVQGHYQHLPDNILGRYYILFRELGGRSASISKMVKRAAGLEPDEIMVIGICFYASILIKKYLDISFIKRHTVQELNDILRPEKVARFLKATSISQDKFRDKCKQWNLDNKLLKKYEFNPLWLYPIIQTGLMKSGFRYIVPSVNDLVYRCTEGIYYSAMEYYRESRGENLFSTQFGPLFQEYVGYFLQDVRKYNRNLGSIKPEMEYQYRDKRIKSADWLLIQTDSVIQTECKKLATSNKFRAGVSDGTDNDFNAVLNRFAGYVSDIYEKSTHIKQGILSLSSTIVKEVFSVFVVLDDLYLVDSRFKKEITNRVAQNTLEIPEDFRYHIVGCTEFEVLCEFLKTHPGKNLRDLLRLKEEGQNYYMEFGYFLEKYFNYRCSKISLIREGSDNLWNSVGLGYILEPNGENAI